MERREMIPKIVKKIKTYHTLEPPENGGRAYDWFIQTFCSHCQGVEWLEVHEFVISKLDQESITMKLVVCRTCGEVVLSSNKKVIEVVGRVRADHIRTLEWLFSFKEIFWDKYKSLDRIKHFLEE